MRVQFQVIRDGDTIYSMDFPTDERWQFAEFSKVALADFHVQFPGISLIDDDVIMNWAELPE